jgi:transposase
LIERAYTEGERRGLAVWGQDEAGPFQTMPYAGASWAPAGEPVRQAHEYHRTGTAKLLTLFHPADGQVRVKGVTSTANAVLHPWLKAELSAILATLPPVTGEQICAANRAEWLVWQEGLTQPITLPAELPPLRMLLIWDNLAGHSTPELVLWLFRHGIMPLYTPLSGSWLNMTESVQRILKRRALEGHHPQTADEIIVWLEATARGWNQQPTPFVWGGKRALRRGRQRARRHVAGGSGACPCQPVQRRRPTGRRPQLAPCRGHTQGSHSTATEQWRCAC